MLFLLSFLNLMGADDSLKVFYDDQVLAREQGYIQHEADEACKQIEKLLKRLSGEARVRLQVMVTEIREITEREKHRLWDEEKKPN